MQPMKDSGSVPMYSARAIAERVDNGVLLFGDDCLVFYANPAAVSLLGLTFPSEEPLDVRELTGKLDLNRLERAGDVPIRRGQQTIHYRIIPLEDEGNGMAYALVLTESSKYLQASSEAEAALRLTSEMEEILEGSFDGILVTDGDGNVQFVNSSYERVAAISKKELVGHNMRSLINPVWMANAVTFAVAQERKTVSKRQITKDGRDIIVTGRPIFDNAGNIKRVVINARDFTEIFQLREELLKAKEREIQQYQQGFDGVSAGTDGQIVLVSESIKKVFSLATQVGSFDSTVLITGESGVGKEEVARQIHRSSMRKDHALVIVNCGAIPENLLESELFGYEKGAFTGALNSGKVGLLEAADGGTVFLDEIGDIPLSCQVKLLRALETKQITRVGGVSPRNIDVRFIAATNQDLTQMIHDKTFREDLYYRINVVSIMVPPLRQRKDDILPLSLFFLNMFNHKYNQSKVMTPEVITRMEEYEWKGNVRELRNIVERMVIMSPHTQLQISDVPWIIHQCTGREEVDGLAEEREEESTDMRQAVQNLEIRLLKQAREACASTREMARYLNLDQSTVVRKMQKYGIS